MFRKLCLSTIFTALSFASISASVDRITAIQNTLTHISQEKKSIALEAQKIIIFGKKALKLIQERLNDDYAFLRIKIIDIINIISESEEFDYSLNKVTDLQTFCIIDQGMHFDDITYDPADYPINQKIDSELAKAFPELDEQTEQLFNIWYIMSANMSGSKLLLEKLTIKENKLFAELEALETANQTINN